MFDLRVKFYADRPMGNFPGGALNRRAIAKQSDGGPISYLCHVQTSHLLVSFLYFKVWIGNART